MVQESVYQILDGYIILFSQGVRHKQTDRYKDKQTYTPKYRIPYRLRTSRGFNTWTIKRKINFKTCDDRGWLLFFKDYREKVM